jgi:hypothetical protein
VAGEEGGPEGEYYLLSRARSAALARTHMALAHPRQTLRRRNRTARRRRCASSVPSSLPAVRSAAACVLDVWLYPGEE